MESKLIGRPPLNLDWNKIDNLLIAGCSGREIAGNLEINQKTLYEHSVKYKGMSFSDYSDQFHGKGDSILRSKQYKQAIDGDTSLLIWLGKTRLKQKEHKEISGSFTFIINEVNPIDAIGSNSECDNTSTISVQMPTISECSMEGPEI